jgi:type IX secretion system PorP/SprF family membrane protein
MKFSRFLLKFFLCVTLIYSVHMSGQTLLPINYHQSNTAILYNPAAWNTDILKYSFLPTHAIGIQFRKQWLGIDAAPQNYFLGYDLMKPKNMIFGLGILKETFGPYDEMTFATRVAYRKFVSSKSFFSIGFQAGFTNLKYDPSDFRIEQISDQILINNGSNSSVNLGAGISFSSNLSLKSNFTIGVGLLNIATVNLSDKDILSKIPIISFHSQYFKFFSEDYDKLSYIECKLVSRITYQLIMDHNISFKYQYKGLIGLTPGIRIGQGNDFALNAVHLDLNLPLGNFIKKDKIGFDLNYSFEYSLNNIKSISTQSHEIGLAFLF